MHKKILQHAISRDFRFRSRFFVFIIVWHILWVYPLMVQRFGCDVHHRSMEVPEMKPQIYKAPPEAGV